MPQDRGVLTDLFDGCWTRWDRANEHRTAMAGVWNEYLSDHPFDYSLDDRGDGEFVLQVHQSRPVPALFSVLCGEWLYNLRGCLDYVIWATVAHHNGVVPPPDEGKLQYPIYASPREWQRSLYRLKGLAEHHREMLLRMQPFNSDPDANFLGWLNELARVDRHRRLNTATAYVAEAEPVIEVPNAAGRTTTLQWGQRVLVNGQADLARILVRPWDESLETDDVRVNPRVGIDPEIAGWAHSPFWRRVRFSEPLVMIQIFVAGEIATYEYDCTGQSRKADLLTAEYKTECDGRRTDFPPLQQPPVIFDWSEPAAGKQSSRARFEGRDFPREGPSTARPAL
jgi:hypothetical protein